MTLCSPSLEEVYLQAVSLEYAYEQELAVLYNCLELSTLPRPLVLKQYLPSWLAPLVRRASSISLLVKPLLTVFFLYKLVPNLFRRLLHKPKNVTTGGSVYLKTSNGENLRYAGIDVDRSLDIKGSAGCISAFDVILLKEYFKIIGRFLKVLIMVPSHRVPPLYFYSFLDFSVVFYALKRLEPSILVFSNQYDRWVELGSRFGGAQLVQHGTVLISDGEYIDFSRRLNSSKINVDVLHVFEQSAEEAFKTFISPKTVKFFSITQPLPRAYPHASKVVLVAGGSDKLDFFESLLRLLATTFADTDVLILYKPHPRSLRVGDAILKFATVIERAVECDVYVSYGSTLDQQYLGADCNKVIYDWRERDIFAIVEDVRRYV